MNTRWHLCFGGTDHPHGIFRPELLLMLAIISSLTFIVTRILLLQHFLRSRHAVYLSLLFGKKHQFQFFYLGVQLVKHVLLHGEHLIFDLHLLLRMLLCDLLDFYLGLQLGHLTSVGSVLFLQVVDLLLQSLNFRLLPRQVVLFELLFGLLKHQLGEVFLLKVMLSILNHVCHCKIVILIIISFLAWPGDHSSSLLFILTLIRSTTRRLLPFNLPLRRARSFELFRGIFQLLSLDN